MHPFAPPRSSDPAPFTSRHSTLQVTGPVLRFANQIAAQGYIVAAPNVFHEFAGNEPIPYDTKGTDDGNSFKVRACLSLSRETCVVIDP